MNIEPCVFSEYYLEISLNYRKTFSNMHQKTNNCNILILMDIYQPVEVYSQVIWMYMILSTLV